jgi:hypothetical protein
MKKLAVILILVCLLVLGGWTGVAVLKTPKTDFAGHATHITGLGWRGGLCVYRKCAKGERSTYWPVMFGFGGGLDLSGEGVAYAADAPSPNEKRIAELQARNQQIVVEMAGRQEIIQQHQTVIGNLQAELQQNVGAIRERQLLLDEQAAAEKVAAEKKGK